MSRLRSVDGFYVAGVVVAAGWAIAAAVAIAWGTLLNWPDFVHINYGFPVTFATHTTSTFVGAVDEWSLDIGALAGDILFWIAGTIVIFIGFIYLARREAKSNPASGERSALVPRTNAASSPEFNPSVRNAEAA